MKRFGRVPFIEELEEKRLKAADVAHGLAADSPTAEAAAVATVKHSDASIGHNKSEAKASLVSEQAGDDSDDENEADIDESTDESDESESDDSESDDSESDDSESDDSESDDSESDDNESDDNETNDSESDDNGDETELSTNLTATEGNSGTGEAEFESDTDGGSTEKEFSLEVKGVTTNSSLVTGSQEVRVGGVLVGSIDLTSGKGKLEFSTDPDDGETTLPANFPTTVDSTTVVAVGPANAPILTGTLGSSSDLQSLAASRVVSSGSGSAAVDGLLLANSRSVDVSASGSEAAGIGAAENVEETISLDLNLADAGFAAAVSSTDSVAEAAPHSDDLIGQTEASESQSLDAAFESLELGDLTWTA